jgi:5,10-methylenetetrahydrofolate reductase
MTKVAERYRDSNKPLVVVADFSPPRRADLLALDRIAGLEADFVSVAYNPGKLVRVDSVAMAYAIKQQVGMGVAFNLATRDMNKIALESHLLGAQVLGLENVIVMQGDDFTERDLAHGVKPVGDFTSSGFIRAIAAMNEGRDYRGAELRAPTDFCIGATLDLGRDLESEVALAQQKVEAGVHFFISQPIYDLTRQRQFLEMYEATAKNNLSQPVFWGVQILEKEGIVLGDVPAQVIEELQRGRAATEMALELLNTFVESDIRGVYVVPPILRGGARNYEAAHEVLRAFGQQPRQRS